MSEAEIVNVIRKTKEFTNSPLGKSSWIFIFSLINKNFQVTFIVSSTHGSHMSMNIWMNNLKAKAITFSSTVNLKFTRFMDIIALWGIST